MGKALDKILMNHANWFDGSVHTQEDYEAARAELAEKDAENARLIEALALMQHEFSLYALEDHSSEAAERRMAARVCARDALSVSKDAERDAQCPVSPLPTRGDGVVVISADVASELRDYLGATLSTGGSFPMETTRAEADGVEHLLEAISLPIKHG